MARISDTFDTYFDSYEDWHLRTSQQTDIHDFIMGHSDELGFSQAESMIRVGAGDGVLDSLIIRSCMSNLKVYYGLENTEELFLFLPDTIIRECFAIDSLFYKGTIGTFKGPDQLVDLVFIMPFYFHQTSTFEEDIRRVYSWLRPGGRIIIGLLREGTFFDILDLRLNPFRRTMTDQFIRRSIENIGLESTDYNLYHHFHVQNLGALFAHFCLFKHCDADEIDAVLKLVDEMKTNENILHIQSVFRVIRRD